MLKRIVITAIVLLIAFGALFGTKYLQMTSYQGFTPPPHTVNTAVATAESWDVYITAIGSVGAFYAIEVRNEVAGTVKGIHFGTSENLNKGQLLVELDDEVEQAQLRSLESRYTLAKINFDRDRKLIARKLASREQLDKSSAELADIKAQVEATKAIIARKKVYAPFDGKSGITLVSIGQHVPENTAFTSLISMNHLYVDFYIPEHQFPKLERDQVLMFKVDAYPDQAFSAKVLGLDSFVDVNTRNIRARALIDNPDNKLVPGMFASVKVQLNQADTVTSIPLAALSYSLHGETVYVINEAEGQTIAQQKYVKVGRTHGERIAITEGLSPGEQVVVDGQIKLFSGAPVKVINATIATPSAAAAE